jgi:hypothetical protein
MTDIYAKCPKCDNRLNISQQLRDVLAEMVELREPKLSGTIKQISDSIDRYEKGLAENTLPDTMIASIWCESCQEYTLVLALGKRDESILPKAERLISKKARLSSKKHVS